MSNNCDFWRKWPRFEWQTFSYGVCINPLWTQIGHRFHLDTVTWINFIPTRTCVYILLWTSTMNVSETNKLLYDLCDQSNIICLKLRGFCNRQCRKTFIVMVLWVQFLILNLWYTCTFFFLNIFNVILTGWPPDQNGWSELVLPLWHQGNNHPPVMSSLTWRWTNNLYFQIRWWTIWSACVWPL